MKGQVETGPEVGQLLTESYRLERIIGEGGMGTVYEASHTRIDRTFAIKVLRCKIAGESEALARFEREAMLGSKLENEHIVEVVDFNRTDEGHPYIVMELLRGQSLHEALVEEPRLGLLRAASIVRQICLALTTAHAEGIVHRDLKPENIFLCRGAGGGERVKVLDFGISKVMRSGSIQTEEGVLLGTPWYMAPEQIEADASRKVDRRTDLYAAGLLMYQMLAGRLPFDAESAPAALLQALQGEATPLWELRPDLPEEVIQVVNRATTRSPEGRYQSAAELVEALEQALQPSWSQVLMLVTASPGDAPAAEVGSPPATGESGDAAATPHESLIVGEQGRRRKAGVRAVALLGLAGAAVLIAALVLIERNGQRRAAPGVTVAIPGSRPSRDAGPRGSTAAPSAHAQADAGRLPRAQPRAIIRLDVTPPTAVLKVDGEVIHGSVSRLSRGSSHIITASAPGYRSRRYSLTAEEDRTLRIVLKRSPSGKKTGAAPASASPRPTPAAATPQKPADPGGKDPYYDDL